MSNNKERKLIFISIFYNQFDLLNTKNLLWQLSEDLDQIEVRTLFLSPFLFLRRLPHDELNLRSELEYHIRRSKDHLRYYYLNEYLIERAYLRRSEESDLIENLHTIMEFHERGLFENTVILIFVNASETKLVTKINHALYGFNTLNIKIHLVDYKTQSINKDINIFYPLERDKLIMLLKDEGQFGGKSEYFSPDILPSPAKEQLSEIKKNNMFDSSKETDKFLIYKDKEVHEWDDVFIGSATPKDVSLDEEFVVRFTAYTAKFRNTVNKIISQEATSVKESFELEKSKWKKGMEVTVHFHSSDLEIENSIQKFNWNGAYHILRFDAKVKKGINKETIILKFDVSVEKLPILFIRPEINITKINENYEANSSFNIFEQKSPKTAFASFAKQDKRDVLSRIRSVEISTGMDVFIDCLSIAPGEKWKPRLENEIKLRDIFWLFWSRKAQKSKWVEWEWRTALKYKTIAGIQPHPLEPADLAPPPAELSELQFGSFYELNIMNLENKKTNNLIHRLKSFFTWK